IQRAIKKGRLSATRDDGGAYQIDAAELHRVYPPKPDKPKTAKTGQGGDNNETPLLRREIEIRDERITQLEAERRRERDQLEETIEDLRKRLDTESAERQRLTLLITDQRDREAKKKRGLFGWRAS
ncbi:MAG: hypothetical protein KC594_17675, partial [Nitrospira sp.]|nr:hypothetical protein [Nitrospira sp.]